jgi:hypothetical protein
MKDANKLQSTNNQDSAWATLYKVGGVAALVAGVVFRRNIGAEILLFTGQTKPSTVTEWFTLLQSNSALGLSLLNIFDIVNYALVGIMFLALYAALKRTNQSYMAIATTFGLVGASTYFASNTSLSMLSLSNQYATAVTEAQKSALFAAGQTMLTVGAGTGVYMSLLLLAVAGLLVSVVMLQSKVFGKITAYTGIVASAFDLTYCITFAFIPELDALLLSAAGLALMIWHILLGRKLYKLKNYTTKWGVIHG